MKTTLLKEVLMRKVIMHICIHQIHSQKEKSFHGLQHTHLHKKVAKFKISDNITILIQFNSIHTSTTSFSMINLNTILVHAPPPN